MDRRNWIKPGTKVGLSLTVAERKVILDNLMSLDDSYAQVIRETPTDQPVQFSLDEWEDFGGCIADEANHTEDQKLGKKLDGIFTKVQKILDTHTDEEPPNTLSIEDARKTKQLSDQAVQMGQWVAQVLAGAEQSGLKDKPLEHFWLAPAQREVLLLVPGVSKKIKDKLVKEGPAFTVAEVASMTMALVEDLLNGGAQKHLAVLHVAKHLLDRLQEGVIRSSTSEETQTMKPKTKSTSSTIYQFKITLKGIEAADLAANPDQGLHPRQAPRAHPDGDGLDEFPSPPVRDRRRSPRRSPIDLRGLGGGRTTGQFTAAEDQQDRSRRR